MILRDYQNRMVDDTRTALATHRSVVIQSECGSGKGTVAAYMINRAVERGRRVLFIVRGRDRVADMDMRVTKLGIPHGVLMGGSRRERHHAVQIASIDTLHRMEHKPRADMLVLDECHYALSRTFRDVLDAYGSTKIIGMSATPALGNGKPLGVKAGGIFEAMVKGPTVNELIAEGHLVGSRVFAPPAPAALKGLKKKSTGEFDSEQGAAICDNTKVIGDVVEHWKRYGSDRKAAIFGFNQKHAFDIAESFRAAGVNFAYVDANTPDGDIHTPGTRKFFWHQYEHGDLVGVAAVNVISLGWDAPPCKYIGLACKTASFPLFRQRLGRGSRPYKGFKHFIVADHCAGLYEFEEQGPYFESEIDWQLDGEPARRGEKGSAPRVATCKVPLRLPDGGLPHFKGPLSPDGRWALPCFQAFPPGPEQCPYCGLPLEKNVRKIEVEAGELQEVTPGPIRSAVTKLKSPFQIAHEERLKARYLELVKIGVTKGYKAGWAAIRLNDETHRWPQKEWKQAVEKYLEAVWGYDGYDGYNGFRG